MTAKLKRADSHGANSSPIVGITKGSHPVQSCELDTISIWDTLQVEYPWIQSHKKAKNVDFTVEVRQQTIGVSAIAAVVLDGWQ